jgi:SAM-dependent methyltransferase
MTQNFYDRLAPYFHLLYQNWEASTARQSSGLARVLSEFGVAPGSAILDAACGIGTQALGLAHLGYSGRPASCRPAAFASDTARFFPLTHDDERWIESRWP